jgi:hypothetical protein
MTRACTRCGKVYFIVLGHSCSRRLALADVDVEREWQALLPEIEPPTFASPGRQGRHARERRSLRYWRSLSRTSRKARLAIAERQAAELAEQLAEQRAVVSALLRCLG